MTKRPRLKQKGVVLLSESNPNESVFPITEKDSEAKTSRRTKSKIPPCQLQVAIGQELRRARLEAGMSQFELSTRCGLRDKYISRVELGQMNITAQTIERFAEALDQSVVVNLRPKTERSD